MRKGTKKQQESNSVIHEVHPLTVHVCTKSQLHSPQFDCFLMFENWRERKMKRQRDE